MRRIVIGLLFISCMMMTFCFDIPKEIKSTLDIIFLSQDENYFNSKWKREVLDPIYHPDGNIFASEFYYNNDIIEYKKDYGKLIFVSRKISAIKTGKEKLVVVDASGNYQKTEVTCFFVNVEYELVSHIRESNDYKVFVQPEKYTTCYILVKDFEDGKYKIFDQRPSFQVSFLFEELFLRNYSKVPGGEGIYEMLEK